MPEEILVNDPVQRRFQYRLDLPIVQHHRGTIDVIDLGDDTCVVTYQTDCDPRTMALTIGGGTAGALDELRRQMESDPTATATRPERSPDGPQDPLRHHRPAALRHARVQRRHGRPHPGGRRPRRRGVRYERAHPQSVVCMPSRSTMLTGQHPSTHGVWMNGVPLPVDAPSVAAVLHGAGYRTALIGKPHFEPFLDPFARFEENRFARDGRAGPAPRLRAPRVRHPRPAGDALHYARWIQAEHPEAVGMFYPVLDGTLEVNAMGGGDTGAPQVHDNPIAREWYHTDWVADRTIAWLDSLDADDDWFCWMSFPDPHHPWDPPASELGRIDWRDVPLPTATSRRRRARAHLDAKPRHWRAWYDGRSCRTTRRRSTGCRPR
jgi:arylsulfatase A-like enzyme